MNNSSAKVWINNIIFNDGTRYSFNPDDIVIFVGANNVGKSKSITGMLRWGTLHTEAIFNVSKNDIIKCDVLKSNNREIGFYDYTQNFGSGNGCYLIVEVIE